MDVLRPLWLAPVVLLTTMAPAQQQVPASVAQKVILHIAPQPVGDALSEFGRQTGLTIMIQSAVARGVISPRLEGEYTPASALDQLLAHTGLRYEYLDAKTVAVLGPRAGNKATARRISAVVSLAIHGASQSTGQNTGQSTGQNTGQNTG
ncbi:MAG: STN domain-containing protein [Steroidobacteraceae bacterium]